jgi:hypothetical protein
MNTQTEQRPRGGIHGAAAANLQDVGQEILRNLGIEHQAAQELTNTVRQMILGRLPNDKPLAESLPKNRAELIEVITAIRHDLISKLGKVPQLTAVADKAALAFAAFDPTLELTQQEAALASLFRHEPKAALVLTTYRAQNFDLAAMQLLSQFEPLISPVLLAKAIKTACTCSEAQRASLQRFFGEDYNFIQELAQSQPAPTFNARPILREMATKYGEDLTSERLRTIGGVLANIELIGSLGSLGISNEQLIVQLTTILSKCREIAVKEPALAACVVAALASENKHRIPTQDQFKFKFAHLIQEATTHMDPDFVTMLNVFFELQQESGA